MVYILFPESTILLQNVVEIESLWNEMKMSERMSTGYGWE